MLYIQSLIVYISLLIGMSIATLWAIQKKKRIYLLIPIFFFSLISGLRYGVGIDYYAYLRSFSASDLELWNSYEPGFIYIIKICRLLGLGPESFFFILAFLQIFFLYFSFRKNTSVTIFLPSALILTGIAMSGYMNNIRQTIAFCIFVFSVHYIAKRNFFRYLLCVATAFLFHKSAVILLPLYWIWRWKDSYFTNSRWQIILASLAFITASFIDLPTILGHFDSLLEIMGYSHYMKGTRIAGESSIGLGYVLVFITYLIIIIYNKKMKLFYNDRTFNIMYDLFFIGCISEFLFRGSMMFNRITYYFSGFKTIFIAYVLYFLYKNKKDSSIMYYSYIVLWIILVYMFARCIALSETNTLQYVFSFQKELHEIKQIQFNNVF